MEKETFEVNKKQYRGSVMDITKNFLIARMPLVVRGFPKKEIIGVFSKDLSSFIDRVNNDRYFASKVFDTYNRQYITDRKNEERAKITFKRNSLCSKN